MRSFLPFAALFGVALLLGCQDVGTGPDGLVPQFNKPADPTSEDAQKACADKEGFIFDQKGHCHAGEEPTVRPTYSITFLAESVVDNIIITYDISSLTEQTRAVKDAHILIVDDFVMDLSFFNGRLSCDIGAGDNENPKSLIGNFQIQSGSSDPPHLHLSFEFEDNGLTNRFGSRLEFVPDPWPPIGDPITVEGVMAQWSVGNKGRNKDACTGEGFADTDSGIDFKILIEPVSVQ